MYIQQSYVTWSGMLFPYTKSFFQKMRYIPYGTFM